MKNWESPKLKQLSVVETREGGNGGDADGARYKVGKFTLIGTSGEAIDLPRV